jgi:hypothetical protein
MRINKTEALVLAKIVHQHTGGATALRIDQSGFDVVLREIEARLSTYLVKGEEEDCSEDAKSDDADKTDDSLRECYDPDCSVCYPSSGEESDEDAEEEEEEVDDNFPESDCDVFIDELDELAPARLASSKSFEFEKMNDNTVNVLVDGQLDEANILYVQRNGALLTVWNSEGDSLSYDVTRFPKGWATALPLESVCEVVVDDVQ